MEKKNKILLIILAIFIVTIFSIRNKRNDQLVEEKINKEDYKAVALHISEDGTNYIETDRMPSSGYVINESKSYCTIDNVNHDTEVKLYTDKRGNHIFENLTKLDKCYLYFDKLTDTTKPIISNVTTSVTKNEITVNVTASDIGIEGQTGTVTEYWYQLNNNTPIKSTSNSYKFTGLSASTTYTIKVYVKDLAGNQSDTTTKSVTTASPTGSDIILANVTVKSGTPNFSKTATTDEGVYKTADGMYGGTTYYWRGAVTTNHVIFANKCWRIVRINGDKTMRLIYNGSVQTGNTCTGNGANSSVIIMGSTKAEQHYATTGNDYNNSSYVGWTYNLGSQRTLSGTASNAKTQTEKWYYSNITGTNAEKVADGKFCNDRNVGKNSSGTQGTWSAAENEFYYAGYYRLYYEYSPTFACNSGDTYTLKVGAITADEEAYAGGKGNSENSNYYLYTGQPYWTMSPCFWNGSHAFVFGVSWDGNMGSSNVDNSNIGLRPVINLRSDITFSSGNGTQNSPYTVSNT